MPVTPIPDARKGFDFSSYNHFNIGVRYMIIPELGARIGFAHEKFSDNKDRDNNLVYSRIDLEAVSNLVYILGFNSHFFDKVGLLVHGGGGYVFANPSAAINNEKVANLMFGVNPIFKLTDKFAVSADFTYLYTIKQHFGFDGQLIEPNFPSGGEFEAFNGGFLNFTVGIKYYFGNNRDHADWL